MLRLATPVVVAELGWTTMGTVDTMMVGRLSPEAIGAVSLGTALFLAVTIFGIGLLLGLDTLVAQAFGAGRLVDCHRALVHGIYAAVILAIPLMGMILLGLPLLPRFGINPDVLELAVPYVRTITYSLFPLLLYAAARRFLQATGHVMSVMWVLLAANVLNVTANWLLIFGHGGFVAMGVVGAGWATFVSRVFLALALFGCIVYYDRKKNYGLLQTPFGFEWSRFRRLLQLGLPAAFQVTLEIGLFAVATGLAARLDAASLAAHQIALSVASTTFMVPLGISSAAAVRVGHAVGAGDQEGARVAGWTAISMGTAFMSLSMTCFLLFPENIIGLFTHDRAVLSVGGSLLFVAAFFQLFDGIQVVTTGALRGIGDTRTPMMVALIGFWLLGLPTAYALCFPYGLGVSGLWLGMLVGLISVGALLLIVWFRTSKQ